MDEPVVIDTNVLIVANKRDAEHASPACVVQCVQALARVKEDGHLVVDDRWAIVSEYQNKVNPSGQPGVGDAFLKWVLTNLRNAARCTQVPITPDPSRGYVEFPDDPALETFDRSDRKFVAVAIAHGGRPPILNAVDSDWAKSSTKLHRHGVRVTQLCEGPDEHTFPSPRNR